VGMRRLPESGDAMSTNVKNGTPLHGPSLCDTCTNAHIQKGYRVSEQLVFCTAHEPVHQVPFAVYDCTGYRDKTRASLWEMEKIAWTIAPQGPKGKAGFVSGELHKDGAEIELILDRQK